MANQTYGIRSCEELEVYDLIDDTKLDPNNHTPLSRRKSGNSSSTLDLLIKEGICRYIFLSPPLIHKLCFMKNDEAILMCTNILSFIEQQTIKNSYMVGTGSEITQPIRSTKKKRKLCRTETTNKRLMGNSKFSCLPTYRGNNSA